MPYGVMIEEGPQNYQILQQSGGEADITLSGEWTPASVSDGDQPGDPEKYGVFARVVREDTADSILPWVECELLPRKKWRVVLRHVPAGGLYRIETCLNSKDCNWAIEWAVRGDMVHHLGVGDIFVIAGQSNSTGYGKDPVYDPPELGVHAFGYDGRWDIASHPLSDSTGAIQTVNMEGGNAGNSPYLSFARMLKRELGYPIGLIPTAMGGTPLSAWNPDEDGYLYRNMLEIVWSQSKHVKGVLWYQGCDDASDAVPELSKSYFDRFRNMVEHLRKDFDNNELPVFTVQLNRMLQLSDQPDTGAWGVVREAQRQAGRKISNTYVVSSLDLPLTDFIHISSAGQLVLGERLAKMALTQLYGRHYICKAPDLSRAEKTGANEVRLIFDNVNCRLCTPDVYGARSLEIDVAALPFSVADQKGPLKIINCEINDKNTIKLRLDREIKGNAVVHGAYEKRQNHLIPVDIEGRLPMLAFYGAELQSV